MLFDYNVTQRAILNSLLLATLAASIAVLLGAVIGWIDVRTRVPGRRLLDYAALVPLGLPGIVMAVALIQFWLTMPVALYGTLAILLLAYVGRYIPLGVRAANASLRQIDPSLEESARVLGASWARTLREITLPLIRPGLFAGWLLVFVPVIQELSASILLFSLELHHAGGSRLQPLRDRLHRAGGGAGHGQHGDHRLGPAGGQLACVRQGQRAPVAGRRRSGGSGGLMAEIAIRGLTKSYSGDAGLAAISDLSLDIAGNQFVTLLGPSGCGKTTTLRLIAGFLTPDAGTIHADGRLVSSRDHVVPPEERGMGMVFQNYAVWPHKTVYENVVFGLKLRRVPASEARARVKSALALVNLTGLEDRLPGELSGGQQQRVALARSLVVEPEILLLDEPLSNLDAKLRERMRSELKQLQRRTGITFVYVTHDQAEALALSDRIAVIHGGRLQQFGTPREVYTRPASRVVADFMGLVNLLPGTMSVDAARCALSSRLDPGGRRA